MWKSLCARGLKGTFEKNVFKVNSVQTTKVTQDSSKKCINYILKISPAITERLNRFYGYYKSCSCGQTNQGKRKRSNRAKQGPFLEDLRYEWLEALQWSTAFMLGWYLCAPLRNRRYRQCHVDQCKHADLSLSKYYGSRLYNYFSSFVFVKPINYVLPEVSAVRSSQQSSESSRDDTLKKGLENVEKAHNAVKGALSNWLGTEAMQKGKHSEAVIHFHDAVRRENAAGVFNLGICYEMGLGTTQDFHLAANLYKKASSLGHATAMYNLGVFYAHGWGGVAADTKQARELFRQAAELGQKDARKALNIDRKPADSGCNEDSAEEISVEDEIILKPKDPFKYCSEPTLTDTTDHWYQLLNIEIDDWEPQKKNRLVSSDSGISDTSPEFVIDFGLS